MNELSFEELELINGGYDSNKVFTGLLNVGGRLIVAGAAGWTGAGIFCGGLQAIGGIGQIVRGIEGD